MSVSMPKKGIDEGKGGLNFLKNYWLDYELERKENNDQGNLLIN
jgi:hypothetical protein